MRNIKVLGNKINIFKTRQEALDIVFGYLEDGKRHQVVTANPEILLEAKHDEELFYIINKADLVVPDGFGLKIACLVSGAYTARITGADLTADILKAAQEKNKKVAIFTWKDGLSKASDVREAIKKKFPNLSFIVQDIDRSADIFYYASEDEKKLPALGRVENSTLPRGAVRCREADHNIQTPALGRVESTPGQFAPDIMLVATGSPWQEKFIYHSQPKLPSVSVAIGVGGTFDFLTGKIKRAPVFARWLGLEWLWRLIKQPWRRKRILNATFIFTYKFIKYKFFYPFLYRPNVACLLYKKANNIFYVLIVERGDEPGHWQLPQGGRDGMEISQAGKKELREEIKCDKFKIVKTFSNLHRYNFIKNSDLYKRHAGYKGQKQGLVIAEFFGQDNDIKVNYWEHINWKWVEAEKLVDEVHATRKRSAEIFLDKFKETF